MAQKIWHKLNVIFWIIATVSLAGIFYAAEAKTNLKFFILPFAIESAGAFVLVWRFCVFWPRAEKKIVTVLQWTAGIFGTAGIFDAAMRLMKRVAVYDSPQWLILDAFFVILFVLWMAVSYFFGDEKWYTFPA